MTINPVAVVDVGVIVWCPPGSSTTQFGQRLPTPATVDQTGIPLLSCKISPSPPALKAESTFVAEP